MKDNYKWTALSNTTLGMFMAALDGSIVIISLPAIFRGINLDPLQSGNIGYLLWILMGYLICIAVLVVSFGRLGDMFGRVRMYNAGFAIFTLASIALSLTPGQGESAALYIIAMRIVQGIGGAFLWANSTAILTDAFKPNERGFALGINVTAAIAGQFVGLILGGLLSDWNWRLIFWINVPVGIFGTIWAYLKLKETNVQKKSSIDYWGNTTFALGLVTILLAVTYGIQPYANHVMGWTSPLVVSMFSIGILLLLAFVVIENRVKSPMFDLSLFKTRAFIAGNLASLFVAISRGGFQFMMIIWLQGIWLPLHGYSFESTPLWAGIYMLPLTIGLLLTGIFAGRLSDKYEGRYFSTGGMILVAICYFLLSNLPVNFAYTHFAILLFFIGTGLGLFAAPNSSSIMNSVLPEKRGQASGMRGTFNNAGQVLSIGIFFSLIIFGLSTTLPTTMRDGLISQNVPQQVAVDVANTPPVSSLFAAFLGYNPMSKLIPSDTLAALPTENSETLTGKTFFPDLISEPFKTGLHYTLFLSMVLCLIAAIASWSRGKRFVATDEISERDKAEAEEGLVNE